MSDPDFLVIGHVSKDLVPEGHRLGGTATYAAITALRLGYGPAVVTRAAQEIAAGDTFHGVRFHRLPSPATTTFRNVYQNGHRRQFVHAVAGPIEADDVPIAWRDARIVLLGPLAQELAPDLAALFPRALIGVVPQGWMRQWDAQGRVCPVPWADAEQVLARAHVLVVSEEDVGGDLDLVARYSHLASHMVLTRGARGATLYAGGQPVHLPARPAEEVDPTGAGDVFAAAFLVRLQEVNHPVEAARFANAVASFSVEAPGVAGIPGRAQVEAWLDRHPRWGWPTEKDG